MIQYYIKSILAISLLAASCQSARADTIFDMYDSDVHDRFDSTSFIGAGFDWSGVGKGGVSGNAWATMITPTYFLSANHAHPGISSTVTFWEDNSSTGATVTRTVVTGQRIGATDLWVGKLDSAVTSAIAKYDIAPAATLNNAGMGAYANQLSYTVGKGGTLDFVVGQNHFDVVDTTPPVLGTFDAIGYVQDLPGDTNFISNHEAAISGGDSGAPSFIVDGGVLKVAGIHAFAATGIMTTDFGPGQAFDYKTPETWNDPSTSRRISFDTFVPNYQAQISAVPEPSCLALFGIATIGLAGYRLRRRKRSQFA